MPSGISFNNKAFPVLNSTLLSFDEIIESLTLQAQEESLSKLN